MKTNQPSLRPTNKLSAAVLVTFILEFTRVVISANWPAYSDPTLWAALTPMLAFGVSYFIKDELNA